MGYKRIGEEISFADFAVSKSLEHNRSIKLMDRINGVVRWRNVEALLMEYYETGKTIEGADAYPPLLLLKCLLLQKCLRPGGHRPERVQPSAQRGLRPGGDPIRSGA